MTHRERLITAWNLKEPDRVPIEIAVPERLRQNPEAASLLRMVDEHADNLRFISAINYGFLGLPSTYSEETIAARPGECRRVRRTHETPAGTFTAITYHPDGQRDHHWEKRFIACRDDLHRLAEASRPRLTWDRHEWLDHPAQSDQNCLPLQEIPHPLGALVRNATMEDVYPWLYEERATIHRFLAAANEQVAQVVADMIADGTNTWFAVCAHEMLLPPWLGHRLFDEFVFPYDRQIYAMIRSAGGKLRAHCHGNCGGFLEKLYEMGIDSLEPLEAPPAGDVVLADAKRRVGDRMFLSGNIPSERFVFLQPSEVRALVREAIAAGAPGGGFSLRTSGGDAGTAMVKSDEQLRRALRNAEAYVQAGLDYGCYPSFSKTSSGVPRG